MTARGEVTDEAWERVQPGEAAGGAGSQGVLGTTGGGIYPALAGEASRVLRQE